MLGNVFEAMMEKGQDQIPDEGFLMTKMPMYFIVTGRRSESYIYMWFLFHFYYFYKTANLSVI
jgi:hypothetical protein